MEAGCYVWILHSVLVHVKNIFANYISYVIRKTIYYHSVAGMGHTEGRAKQSSQETSFWFLFLLHAVGLVQFKPALCSGINWKAAAKLQLAFFCLLWPLRRSFDVNVCPFLWFLSTTHAIEYFLYFRPYVLLSLAHVGTEEAYQWYTWCVGTWCLQHTMAVSYLFWLRES